MAQTTEFLPFHAINEFMRPDFRLSVIRETLTRQSDLKEELSNDLNQKIKKRVSLPGFRSSEKAPALVKVLPTSKAFEKNPDLVAAILACWTDLYTALRTQSFELLKSRNWSMFTDTEGLNKENLNLELIKQWPILPIDFDRRKLPGFYMHWPKGEDFEALYKNYSELYPDSEVSIDKLSLMVVWITMRLPYHVDDANSGDISENSTAQINSGT